MGWDWRDSSSRLSSARISEDSPSTDSTCHFFKPSLGPRLWLAPEVLINPITWCLQLAWQEYRIEVQLFRDHGQLNWRNRLISFYLIFSVELIRSNNKWAVKLPILSKWKRVPSSALQFQKCRRSFGTFRTLAFRSPRFCPFFL